METKTENERRFGGRPRTGWKYFERLLVHTTPEGLAKLEALAAREHSGKAKVVRRLIAEAARNLDPLAVPRASGPRPRRAPAEARVSIMVYQDAEGTANLKRLALAWDVSKAEVVRRLVEEASREAAGG